ncbi:MAG: hypothetical protein NTX05_00640 [Fusobacteria bacterium]|nr:hypothetical protein [Fusobacteriota bacterium]
MYILHFIVLILAVLIIVFAGLSFLKTRLFVIENIYIRIMFLIAGILLLAVSQLFKEMLQADAQVNVQVQNLEQAVNQNTLDIKKNSAAISGNSIIEKGLQVQENVTNSKAKALAQTVSGVATQVSTTKSKVSSLQNSLNSMNSSLGTIQSQMVTQSTIAPMQQQMTQFQTQIQSMSTQITGLNTQLTAVKQQQAQTSEELAAAQSVIAQGGGQSGSATVSTKFAITPTTEFQYVTGNNYIMVYNAEVIPTQSSTLVDANSESVKKKLKSFAQSFMDSYPVASYKDGKGIVIYVNFYDKGKSPTAQTAAPATGYVVQIISDRVELGSMKYAISASNSEFN